MVRRLLVLFSAAALFLAACSSSDDDNQGSGSTPDQTSAVTAADDSAGVGVDDSADGDADADADADADGGDGDGDGDGVGSATVDTAGLKAFLDESYSGEGYSSEVSLLSVGDAVVVVNVQTSFYEPAIAIDFCEAVASYLDANGAGSNPLELVSTSGDDVAMRASADSACEPGADL